MRSFRLDKRAPTKAFQNITARGPEGWGGGEFALKLAA